MPATCHLKVRFACRWLGAVAVPYGPVASVFVEQVDLVEINVPAYLAHIIRQCLCGLLELLFDTD